MRLKPGQAVPAKAAGSAVTNSSGHYAVTASPATLQSMAAPDGIVNLEVVSVSSAGVGTWSFLRRLVRTQAGTLLESASGSNESKPAAAATANLKMMVASAKTPRSPGVPCGWYFIKTLGQHWTTVGGTFVRVSSATQQFSYGYGQSSSLGDSTSPSGNYGTFGQTGTSSSATDTGANFPRFGGNSGWSYQTKFIQGEYGYSCSFGTITWQTRTTGPAGGG